MPLRYALEHVARRSDCLHVSLAETQHPAAIACIADDQITHPVAIEIIRNHRPRLSRLNRLLEVGRPRIPALRLAARLKTESPTSETDVEHADGRLLFELGGGFGTDRARSRCRRICGNVWPGKNALAQQQKTGNQQTRCGNRPITHPASGRCRSARTKLSKSVGGFWLALQWSVMSDGSDALERCPTWLQPQRESARPKFDGTFS